MNREFAEMSSASSEASADSFIVVAPACAARVPLTKLAAAPDPDALENDAG